MKSFIKILTALFKWSIKLLKYYFITVGIVFTILILSIILLIRSCYKEFIKNDYFQTTSNINFISNTKKNGPYILNIKLKGSLITKTEPIEKQIFKLLYGKKEYNIYLKNLQIALSKAQKDPLIYALFLELDELKNADSSDYYYIKELIIDFKKNSSKKIYVWLHSISTYTYLIASVADFIMISPNPQVFITGPVFTLLYLGDTFKKIGIDFEVIKAGQYKSVFEPLLMSKPSPRTLQMYKELESSLRKEIISQIATLRSLSYEEVYKWFEKSIFTTDELLKYKIVNQIGFEKDLIDVIEQDFKTQKKDKLNLISMNNYIKNNNDIQFESPKIKIALIEAEGPIVLDNNENDNMITPMWFKKRIDWASTDTSVNAVVISINSPGGSATASDIIWNYINTLSKIKPTIVYIKSIGASGGYYIAVGANKIIASPFAIVGSIGVAGIIPKISKFKQKYGINFYVISQSKRNKLLNPSESSSLEDQQILKRNINQVYKIFLQRVAQGRQLNINKVETLAEGKVYLATDAIKYKLIDKLGTLDIAISEALQLAKVSNIKEYKIQKYEDDEINILECLESNKSIIRCLRKFKKDNTTNTLTQLNIKIDNSNILDNNLLTKLVRFKKVLFNKEQYFMLWEGFFWE